MKLTNTNNMQEDNPYIMAKKKVKKIKGFYQHVVVYIIVNTIILGIKGWFLGIFSGADPEFTEWVYWNILSSPLIWGVVLLTHGIYIYGLQPHSVIGKWEERKIKEIMYSDETEFRNKIEK